MAGPPYLGLELAQVVAEGPCLGLELADVVAQGSDLPRLVGPDSLQLLPSGGYRLLAE